MKIAKYLIVLVSLFAAQAFGATLKSDVTIDRDQVLVGDLFDDVGDAAAQPVGTAPAPGSKNTYDVSALNRVSRAYSLGWVPGSLDTKLVVSRASTNISTLQIQDAVRVAIGDKIKGTTASNKYDVQLDRRQMEINLPASQSIASIKLVDVDYDMRSYRFRGSLVAEMAKGDNPTIVPVTGRAIPQYDVPVAAHSVQPGESLAESDLNYVTLGADKMTDDLIRSANDLVGKEVRRSLMEGSTISQRDLRPAQLVKRGNLVTMVVANGGLHITAKGRALADGAEGDVVKVMNLTSNKVIEGTVNERGDVEVVIGRNS